MKVGYLIISDDDGAVEPIVDGHIEDRPPSCRFEESPIFTNLSDAVEWFQEKCDKSIVRTEASIHGDLTGEYFILFGDNTENLRPCPDELKNW